MEKNELKSIVEALLLVSDIPLTLGKLKDVLGRTSTKKIQEAIAALRGDYKKANRSFNISEVAAGFQLSTLPHFSPWIKKLYKGRLITRLSKPALETLAIIAFKQPITRPDIETIRGVDVGGVLSTLLERKLITITGRDTGPGKPLIYVTTNDFLQYFGINQLSDLPRPRELEELLKEREDQQTALPEPPVTDELPEQPDTPPSAEESDSAEEPDTDDDSGNTDPGAEPQPQAEIPEESEEEEKNSS